MREFPYLFGELNGRGNGMKMENWFILLILNRNIQGKCTGYYINGNIYTCK